MMSLPYPLQPVSGDGLHIGVVSGHHGVAIVVVPGPPRNHRGGRRGRDLHGEAAVRRLAEDGYEETRAVDVLRVPWISDPKGRDGHRKK